MPEIVAQPTGLQKYTGTPEQMVEAQQMYLYGLQGLPLGAASHFAGPGIQNTETGRPDWGNWKNYIPGALTYLYSGASGLAEMVANATLRNPPTVDVEGGAPLVDQPTAEAMRANPPQIKIPGHEEAVRLNEESVRTALRNIPHFEPTTEAGKVGQDIGIGMGQGATGVLPAGALPKAVSVPLSIVANPPSAAGVGAALGGVAGALTPPGGEDFSPIVLSPDGEREIVSPPPIATPVSDATPVVPTAPSSGFSLIKSAAAATLPPATTPPPPPPVDAWAPEVVAPPAVAPAPARGLRPTVSSLIPQISPDNDTGTSYLKLTAGLAAGAGAAWLGVKHGPRVLNTIADEALHVLHGAPRTAAEGNAILGGRIPQGMRDRVLEMPLPNNASGLTRRWAERGQNQMAVMNEYDRSPLVNPTPASQRAAVAANEMINDPGNANRRIERLFRTGVDQDTGTVFPKMVDYRTAAERLTPGEQEMADFTIWYKAEMNLRKQNIQDASNKGIMPTDANDHTFRVSYPEMSTKDLGHAIALGESNPAIKALVDQNKALQLSIVDYYEKYGLINKQQAAFARTAHDSFMPTIDAEGNYLHGWDDTIRKAGSGYSKPPAPAWDAMDKHFGNSIQRAHRMMWERDKVLKQWRLQQADPTMAQIVTHRPKGTAKAPAMETPTEKSATRRTVTIYRGGEAMTFDVHNSAWWRGLTGGPQVAARNNAIAQGIRSAVTNATTGPLALVTTNPFLMKTVFRDIPNIQNQLHPDTWRGNIERALGRRVPGLPFDPTAVPGTAITMAKDSASVIVKHLADMLASRSDETSMAIRALLGHQKTDGLVAWMRAREAHSKLAYRQAHGVGSTGNRAMLTMQPSISEKGGSFRDPTHETVAPLLNKPNFMRIPQKVDLPNFVRAGVEGARGTVQSAIRLRALVNELYGVIADAPHSYAHDVNIGNPKFTPRELAQEIQTVTGNPGTRGSGTFTRWAASTLPFYNTSIQGGAAWLRAFRDRPFKTTGFTLATTLTSYALLEHLSALLSGPEHVKFLEDKLSNSTQAHNVAIFHGPGSHPTDHTEFPIANEEQWLWPYFSGLMGHAIGTWTAHQDEDALSRIIHTIAGTFDSHVTVDTVKQLGRAAVSSFVPADVSPMFSAAVAAVTGKEMKNVPEQIVQNIISGNPWSSNMTIGGGPKHKVPGQEGSDTTILGADAGALHAITTSIGTAFGTIWDLVNKYQDRAKIGGDDWAYEGLKQDWRQGWQDNTRWMNSVWRNNLPQSTYGPLEERTQQMWRNVSALGNVNSDIKADGFTGMKQPVPLMKTSESPVPPITDPKMRDMYMTIGQFAKGIDREIMPRENQIRAQIANLKSAPFMSDENRRIGNQLSEQLYQIMTKKHRILLDLNGLLSARLGGRHVDVGQHIDWHGTVDQFHY